ncbi:MAG: pilus assembly protein PilM [Dehalococcoidia bacterium]
MARTITVDIDSKAIRLLQVEDGRVERWAMASLETMVMEDGNIADPASLAAQVRRLRRSSGITKGEVVASVSGLYSVTRVLNFAAMPQDDVSRYVHNVIPAENLRLEWQTIRTDDTSQNVLVVGANEHQVNTQAGLLQAAGLSPRVVEFKTVALSRTVNRSDALIINLEPDSLDLVLVVDGMPRVMRTVSLPETPSMEEWASRVVQVVEHTVRYYDSNNRDAPLPDGLPLFLVGSMSEDPVLRQGIEEHVGFPVETFAPDLEFPLHMPAAQYAVNIGLALRQVSRQEGNGQTGLPIPIRINLVPRRRSLLGLVRQYTRILAAAVAGLALAFVLFQLNSNAAQEVKRLDTIVKQSEQQVAAKLAELNKLTQVEANMQSFANLIASGQNIAEAREAIEAILTPGITVSSINISGGTASFTATAGSINDAMEFVETLREDGRFGAIPFDTPSTTFSLSLDLATLSGQ